MTRNSSLTLDLLVKGFTVVIVLRFSVRPQITDYYVTQDR